MRRRNLTTKQISDAFNIPPHTIRQAARRNNLGDTTYGRILFSPEETLSIVLLLNIKADGIKDWETRSVIRSTLYDYCNTKR